MTLRIGCQGWNYPAWVGPFYTPGTKAADFLATYARVFDVVEIDSTWYATPRAKDVARWREVTPTGFTFCPKLVRSITHERRFVDCREVLGDYLDVMRLLGPKLGPILIQCEATLHADEAPVVADFLKLLPKELRFAIEFRHPSWFTEETHALLRDHRVAWTLVQARWIPRKWMLQLGERPTADYSYIRFLGPDREITDFSREQFDRSAELALWAEMIEALSVAVPVYVMVNNHHEGHSPGTVRKLQRMLNRPVSEPPAAVQADLF